MDVSTLRNLQKLYFFLDQNFEDLIAKCTSDDQRQQLRHDYVVARDSFVKARNLVFQDDDPIVKSIKGQFTSLQNQMVAMLAGEKEIVQILGVATDAVNLASRLLALGALA